MKRYIVPSFAALTLMALPLCAGNIVTNGSFETGDFTGWTPGGTFEDTQVVSGGYYVFTGAEDGTYYATLGPVGSDGTLSQTLSDSLGVSYTFSFWLSAVGDNPSDFSAYWNGTQLLSATNPNTRNVWTQYSYGVTGTGSDTITLSFRDDPSYIALDNISVASSSGVPEPATFGLLAGGLIALALRRRRA